MITRVIYLRSYHPDEKLVGKNVANYLINYLKTKVINETISSLKEKFEEFIDIINTAVPKSFKLDAQEFNGNKIGYYLLSFGICLGLLNKLDEGKYNYFDYIKWIINLGGDTDTNAAIVGGLLGAYFGPENLNNDYIKILLSFQPNVSKTEVRRSCCFSPGFGMILAEKIYQKRTKTFEIDPNLIQGNESIPLSQIVLMKHFLDY